MREPNAELLFLMPLAPLVSNLPSSFAFPLRPLTAKSPSALPHLPKNRTKTHTIAHFSRSTLFACPAYSPLIPHPISRSSRVVRGVFRPGSHPVPSPMHAGKRLTSRTPADA